MARLIVKSRDDVRTLELPEGKPLFVGRSAGCDICLQTPTTSRRHAAFLCRNGECGVKDMDSANGTYLNGKRIHNPKRLVHGDILSIGDATMEFVATETEKKRESGRRNQRSRDTMVFTKTSGKEDPVLAAIEEGDGDGESGLPIGAPLPDSAAAAAPEAHEAPPPEDIAADIEDTSAIPEEPPAAVSPAGLDLADAGSDSAAASVLDVGDGALAESGRNRRRESSTRAIPRDEPPPPALFARPAVPAAFGDDADEDGSALAKLNKAAAEAGLVGEFVPDVEDDAGSGRENGRDAAEPARGPAPATDESVSTGLPLDDGLRQAIEARLSLYSFLEDMRQMRADFLARHPKAADAVKAELARQDREIDKIPTPEQAEGMIEKRQAKRRDISARIKEAKEKGEAPPAAPPREMSEAEDMAFSQWQFCVQSGREALPAVWREAFRFMADEPLAGALAAAKLDPLMLMGGGAYCLALEALQEETKTLRQNVRDQLAALPPADGKKERRIGLFGKSSPRDDEEADVDAGGKSHEELAETEKQLINRAAWLNQEAAFMERTLILEFWRLYAEAALAFLAKEEPMPLAVRAFLRHGVIGFKRWWLKDEVREHILQDCEKDVLPRMEVGKGITNILYADEYLAAVVRRECTPALDENLEINCRNSPEWKADKALRRLINSRSQRRRLEDLLETLAERTESLGKEAAAIDDKIAKILPGAKNYRQLKNELGMQRQAYKVETTKLVNLSQKIQNETLTVLLEAEQETQARFDSGELPDPTREFLIRRECDSVRKIGRLLANLKERFLPLALRDNFHVGTDAVNDRGSISGEFAEMERRDPAMFLETLIASKKKANRIDVRISPVVVLVPAAGVLAYSWNPRARPEDGRLAIPTFFIRRRIRERQITYLLADFRWDTSKASAGMDVMTSDTIVAAFMTVRWDWRKRSKEGREKGLVFTDQNDRTNWRRVYEAYSQTAYDSGKKLFNRNYDFYERIIGKYFDLPEDVPLLRK